MRLLSYFLLAGCLAGGAWGQKQNFNPSIDLGPPIPTPLNMVDRMLEVARVRPGDVVYDLGSGDGRIVIAAASKFGARAVGVEIRENLCRVSNDKIHRLGLDDKVSIVQGNMLQVDLSPATVVTLYLLTSSNERLRPLLEKYLRPGARVVSNDFPVRGWKPLEAVVVGTGSSERRIYLYEIGKTR
jgi:16S rRNA A1518/A1519 N6-dimethyltransferase RsmA/KsgA/DIM1 with predicted DNA glycosylase/AP lyase activity